MVRRRRSRISSANELSNSKRSLRSFAKIYLSYPTLTVSISVPSNLSCHVNSVKRTPLTSSLLLNVRRASSGKMRSSSRPSLPATNRDTTCTKQNEDWDTVLSNTNMMMQGLAKRSSITCPIMNARQRSLMENRSASISSLSSNAVSSLHMPSSHSSCSVLSRKAKAQPRTRPMSHVFWKIPVRVAMPSPPPHHETRVLKSSMKDDTKTEKMDAAHRDTRHVAFSATQEVIGTSASTDHHPSDTWYSKVDNEQFLNDTNICAQGINRAMEYAASTFESTYNSPTGLTSPQVLQEYLSTPQEVIGIEHLLTAQKSVRESLKCNHRKTILDEQQSRRRQLRRRSDDDDCCSSNSTATTTTHLHSAISTYMAIERAAYSILVK